MLEVTNESFGEAVERYEKALGDTLRQIEHTGFASGLSREDVVSNTQRLSTERPLTEIEVLEAIRVATRYRSLDEDEIIRVIELAHDRAGSSDDDFLSNIQTISQALQNPLRNLDSSGLALLESDRSEILRAAGRGELDEAQRLLLDALRDNIAKTGLLDPDTFAGRQHRAEVAQARIDRDLTLAERVIRDIRIDNETESLLRKEELAEALEPNIGEDLRTERQSILDEIAKEKRNLLIPDPFADENILDRLDTLFDKLNEIDEKLSPFESERINADVLGRLAQDDIARQFAESLEESMAGTQFLAPESLDALKEAFREVGDEICDCLREDNGDDIAKALSEAPIGSGPGARGPFGRDIFGLVGMPETGMSGGDVTAFDEIRRDGTEVFAEIERASRLATRAIVDGFEEWIDGSLDAEEALRSFARQLSQIGLQKFVLDPFEDVLNTGVDALISSLFGSLFDFPGRASGGPVTAGDPFLVGERGPELFVPFDSGAVVPNDQLGGETVVNQTITVNVHGGINNQGRMTPGQVAAQIGSELARQSRRNN